MSFGNERDFIDHLQSKEKGGRAMKCPLTTVISTVKGSPKAEDWGDCIKEECALWLEDISMCSIKELALELRYTQFRLQDILVKMPHEEQFRK